MYSRCYLCEFADLSRTSFFAFSVESLVDIHSFSLGAPSLPFVLPSCCVVVVFGWQARALCTLSLSLCLSFSLLFFFSLYHFASWSVEGRDVECSSTYADSMCAPLCQVLVFLYGRSAASYPDCPLHFPRTAQRSECRAFYPLVRAASDHPTRCAQRPSPPPLAEGPLSRFLSISFSLSLSL